MARTNGHSEDSAVCLDCINGPSRQATCTTEIGRFLPIMYTESTGLSVARE